MEYDILYSIYMAHDLNCEEDGMMGTIYILVHGAWQGGWIWERVAPLLRERGHTVLAPDLPGHGDDPRPAAEQDLESYAREVAALARKQEAPVILVGHSLGGMTISQAACYAPECVARMVYVCAFLPRDGQSADGLEDGIKPTDWRAMAAAGQGVRLADEGKTTRMDPAGVGDKLMNCLPADEALEIAKRFSPQPLAAQYQPVRLCEAFFAIPKVYIRCLQDHITPLEKQDEMAAATPVEKVYTLDTDHSPFFSAPRQLADLLLEQ